MSRWETLGTIVVIGAISVALALLIFWIDGNMPSLTAPHYEPHSVYLRDSSGDCVEIGARHDRRDVWSSTWMRHVEPARCEEARCVDRRPGGRCRYPPIASP